MKNVFLVLPGEAEKAREMERKLLSLPASSGILFVGVEVREGISETKKSLYHVFVGCSREREASLIKSIAKNYLRGMADDDQIIVEARRGFDRSKIAVD